MRILSIRRSYDADHSSSSYEFFAFDRLTDEQRSAVRKLTGESARCHLRFHYMGDWSDIPSGWPDKLLTMGYDVLVSESYDWWDVCLSLPDDPALRKRLQPYLCQSDTGSLYLQMVGDRMLANFGMHLDYDAAFGAFGQDMFEGLAELFEQVRDELLSGNLGAAWVLYQACGGRDEEEGPQPVESLSSSARTLQRIVDNY
ncbi:MAG: hypothetical protein ACK2VA_11300 [Anaerolineae bacterium]